MNPEVPVIFAGPPPPPPPAVNGAALSLPLWPLLLVPPQGGCYAAPEVSPGPEDGVDCPSGGILWGKVDGVGSFLPSQWSYRKERDFGIRLPLVPTVALPLRSWVTSASYLMLPASVPPCEMGEMNIAGVRAWL